MATVSNPMTATEHLDVILIPSPSRGRGKKKVSAGNRDFFAGSAVVDSYTNGETMRAIEKQAR